MEIGEKINLDLLFLRYRITSYNVCYTKLLRIDQEFTTSECGTQSLIRQTEIDN